VCVQSTLSRQTVKIKLSVAPDTKRHALCTCTVRWMLSQSMV